MDIFDILMLVGGLSLFLFGMNVMGQALERSAGSRLELLLGKMTSNKYLGLLMGLGVTAVIQSSSATTVMVVGFVNSSLMSLRQAIHVIMGANIGTTVTAWILSLSGVSGENLVLQLLKPMSFTPILALIGLGFQMLAKTAKKKEIGNILLGFAVLMFGMDIMSDSVAGLAEVPAFRELFVMFQNPILGVLVGALLTAVVQSSSASVGILQAFALTGQISFGAAVPIIMGQNIGTCITAILASFGTNKNAKRAALVHLSFNMLGTLIWLSLFSVANAIFRFPIFDAAATPAGIAVAHSIFNIACVLLLFPMSGLLEKLAYKLVPDAKIAETASELDERLLATPAVALERSCTLSLKMASVARESLLASIRSLDISDPELAKAVHEAEDKTDHYEDIIGTYLVKLSAHRLNEKEGAKATMLLKAIGDFERIGDHAVNILESAEELREKAILLSPSAKRELSSLCDAVGEALELSCAAFAASDLAAANLVEPLEEVIDRMKDLLRSRHIERLRAGDCSIEAGFVWSDLLTNLERVSDHCSNIAACMIDAEKENLSLHESLRQTKKESPIYREQYEAFAQKYLARVTE